MRHERILIVDPDLGFLFWLGHTLSTAGYAALPAKGMREACGLVTQLSLSGYSTSPSNLSFPAGRCATGALPPCQGLRVDLLFVFPWMTGVDTFVNRFRSRHEGCTVIALCEDLDIPLYLLELVDKCWAKPDRLDASTGMEWLDAIENNFRQGRERGIPQSKDRASAGRIAGRKPASSPIAGRNAQIR